MTTPVLNAIWSCTLTVLPAASRCFPQVRSAPVAAPYSPEPARTVKPLSLALLSAARPAAGNYSSTTAAALKRLSAASVMFSSRGWCVLTVVRAFCLPRARAPTAARDCAQGAIRAYLRTRRPALAAARLLGTNARFVRRRCLRILRNAHRAASRSVPNAARPFIQTLRPVQNVAPSSIWRAPSVAPN